MVTEGSIIYRANQLGSQTLASDMMNALSDAPRFKAPIARFADKVAASRVCACRFSDFTCYFRVHLRSD